MIVMYVGWKVLKRTRIVGLQTMDLETDRYEGENAVEVKEGSWKRKGKALLRWLV